MRNLIIFCRVEGVDNPRMNPHNPTCSRGRVFKLLPGSPLRGKLLQARVRLELCSHSAVAANCTELLDFGSHAARAEVLRRARRGPRVPTILLPYYPTTLLPYYPTTLLP